MAAAATSLLTETEIEEIIEQLAKLSILKSYKGKTALELLSTSAQSHYSELITSLETENATTIKKKISQTRSFLNHGTTNALMKAIKDFGARIDSEIDAHKREIYRILFNKDEVCNPEVLTKASGATSFSRRSIAGALEELDSEGKITFIKTTETTSSPPTPIILTPLKPPTSFWDCLCNCLKPSATQKTELNEHLLNTSTTGAAKE